MVNFNDLCGHRPDLDQAATVGKDRCFDQPGGSGSRGGNRGPLGQQEPVGGDAEGGMVMEAAPAAPLIVAEAQLLLEL